MERQIKKAKAITPTSTIKIGVNILIMVARPMLFEVVADPRNVLNRVSPVRNMKNLLSNRPEK